MGITLARDKAFTALVNRMPTRDLAPLVQPGTEFYGYDSVAGGRTIVFAGGMPLERDGILVGACGVSGGDAAQDQQAVDAAVGGVQPGVIPAAGFRGGGPASDASRAALSVRSHGRSRSGRPKCPYAAVWR